MLAPGMARWLGLSLHRLQHRSSLRMCQYQASVRARQSKHRAVIVDQVLTVPFDEPSVVPFELFCMTAVADLESLMVMMIRSGEGECRWAGLDAGPTGGQFRTFIYTTSVPSKKQVRLQLLQGPACRVKRCSPGY